MMIGLYDGKRAPGGESMERRTSLEITDSVARISLDDGKVNALSLEMIRAIGVGLDAAEQAAAVVVLQGREGIFSAGFDLRSFARGRDAGIAMVRAGAQLILRLLDFPQPVMTVCTGHAYPAGAFLMLAADVRFGAAGPWRIGMNEVAIAMTVPKFAVELARHRLSPPGFARISSAAMFAPEEAARLGYLDRVLPVEALAEAVNEEVQRLCALDRPSFVATKSRINGPAIQAIRAALEDELLAAAGD
jgi:enoyl-CoA hydratase